VEKKNVHKIPKSSTQEIKEENEGNGFILHSFTKHKIF
jgi:hypothetical protein